MDIGLDAVITASKKVVHKAGEYLGKKLADRVTKSKSDQIVEQELVEKIIIPPDERDETLSKLRQVLIKKMEHYKISKLLNDSAVSKHVTKNGWK